ncbi:MAG: biopolymer transporter ExbD, partial [Paramuribaculum sp.]|nr:biopolymer transporter ExbD [Paramuribaculum sp.]
MALKRQFDMTSLFSMASMTDVIFLLLIFFMVTSTFVFPTALEINLPQSSEQTAIKPTTRVYIDKDTVMYVSYGEMEPQAVAMDQLEKVLNGIHQQDTTIFVAIYADESINYGTLVEVLTRGDNSGMKLG